MGPAPTALRPGLPHVRLRRRPAPPLGRRRPRPPLRPGPGPHLAEGVYALEVVARAGDRLHFTWRGPSLAWQGPFLLVADDAEVTGTSGAPAIIQSRFGSAGRNFEVLVPLAGGGVRHLWRDNDGDDPARWAWHVGTVLDPGGAYESVSVLHGPLGAAPGNLEVVARRADGAVMFFWYDVATSVWDGPGQVM